MGAPVLGCRLLPSSHLCSCWFYRMFSCCSQASRRWHYRWGLLWRGLVLVVALLLRLRGFGEDFLNDDSLQRESGVGCQFDCGRRNETDLPHDLQSPALDWRLYRRQTLQRTFEYCPP